MRSERSWTRRSRRTRGLNPFRIRACVQRKGAISNLLNKRSQSPSNQGMRSEWRAPFWGVVVTSQSLSNQGMRSENQWCSECGGFDGSIRFESGHAFRAQANARLREHVASQSLSNQGMRSEVDCRHSLAGTRLNPFRIRACVQRLHPVDTPLGWWSQSLSNQGMRSEANCDGDSIIVAGLNPFRIRACVQSPCFEDPS